jgi:hypothetical protein
MTQEEILIYLNNAIKDEKAVKILYEKESGEQSARILSNIEYSDDYFKYTHRNSHIRAFCHLRNEDRTFSIARIKNIEILSYYPEQPHMNEKTKSMLDKLKIAIEKQNDIKLVYPSTYDGNSTRLMSAIELCTIHHKTYVKGYCGDTATMFLVENIVSLEILNSDNFYIQSAIEREEDYEYHEEGFEIEKIDFTQEYTNIINIVENTNNNIFITGGAGTGKSTLLLYIMEHTTKKYVVLAPTGIASINVGGQTIHSFFKFPIGIFDLKSLRKNMQQKELFESLQLLIIDEISMVRVDILLMLRKKAIIPHVKGRQ